jgi:flagellar basal-body rod modification protein FlgD
MNINLNPATTSTTASTSTPSNSTTAASIDPLASENVFLQLFIAQLENQDPTTPADPTTFVTQLAQFTTLEQSTQQTSDLNGILAQLQASATPPVNGSGTGTGTTGVS